MPVSIGEWRVRIGRFIHRGRENDIRDRKEKLLEERIRLLKLLEKRLLEKKEKSEDECDSKPNDSSVKVDNAQNESTIEENTTQMESTTYHRSNGTDSTFRFFFTLLLPLFTLLLSLIFFFVFDSSNLLESYKPFLNWDRESTWRITCLIIIIVCSSFAYIVLSYRIKDNDDLQDNLVAIKDNNVKDESTIKVNNTTTKTTVKSNNSSTESNIKETNTGSETTIRENSTPPESTIKVNNIPNASIIENNNNTVTESRFKEKKTTIQSTKECKNTLMNYIIKERNTPIIRDEQSERKTSKTTTSNRKVIKEENTITKFTIREKSAVPEPKIRGRVAPKEWHISTLSTMTDKPSKRKTPKRKTLTSKRKMSKNKTAKEKKRATKTTIKANNSPTESNIKEDNMLSESTSKGKITQTKSTLKKDNTRITESTIKENNFPNESNMKENTTTTGSTIKEKSASTESSVKYKSTSTKTTIRNNSSSESTIKENNTLTESTIKENNTPSESTIKENNTPTESTIKENNTPTESLNEKNNTTAESTSKDSNTPTKSTNEENDTSTESTLKGTSSTTSIKDNGSPTESTNESNNSRSESTSKDSNTKSISAIKERNTPSRTPTGERNEQPMKVNSVQAEYTIRSGTQKVLSDGKHGISSQIPSSLKGTTDDPVMQESTCLSEMILVKAGDVEQNPGPFHRSVNIQEQELLNLAYDVPSSRYAELCIALGVSYTQSQTILDRHLLDFTRSLNAVFFQWKDRQSDGTDCRQLIVEALRGIELDALGEKMANGGYLPQEATTTDTTNTSSRKPVSTSQRPSASTSVDIFPVGVPVSAEGEVSISIARRTEESREQDFDDLLTTVARQIHMNTDIDSLGKELGFDAGATARYYIQRNEKYKTVTYMGMLSMLLDWRNMTTRSKERQQLKKALVAIGHNRLADDLLNDDLAKQTDIDLEERRIIQEAIRSGTAQWNRSRIMVIGPAGVGKTSLIRRLTGQKFNPEEKSTKGAEQNVVTNNAVSSWKLVNGAQTGKDDIMQSIAAMEPNIHSHSPCSTGGEENRNDPEITGSNRSTLGKGSKSEATKDDVPGTGDADRNIAAISQGITQKKITEVKSSKLGITYSMWDFGGQEIYYITHPLFLSWRSLYILVIPLHLELSDRAPREEDPESGQEQLKGSAVRTHRTILDLVHFWLMSVYTHAVPASNLGSTYEPNILLIGTFAGDVGPEIIEKKATDKFEELKERLGSYPYWKQVLSPMCAIDNQFSQTFEVKKIQDRIDGVVKDSAYMKVLMPIKWRTFTTEIEDSDQNTLKVTEAHSIMKRWGINDLKEVKAVLKFYHDIGHLIYHQGCELVVLKPQFLNSIVSNIITVIDDKKMGDDPTKCWKYLKEEGVLTLALIQAVWKEHNGDPDQLNNIISMMIRFDLICEIPERSDERRFFVPCRSSPKLDKSETLDKDEKVEFTIDFHHFLPDGFLHRFYVRMAKWSMERNTTIQPIFHCRQMVFYIDNDHRVVMTNDIHEGHEIKVMIYAVAPYGAPSERQPATVNLNKDIIQYLHTTLEDLKELWARRIKYRVGIWCPRCPKYGRNGAIYIRDILKDQAKTAYCDDGCAIDVRFVRHILEAFKKGQDTPTPTTVEIDEVSDGKLNTLAAHVPNNKYHDLSDKLGIEHNLATNFLEKHRNDYKKATRECFSVWKNNTGGGLCELKCIFDDVGLGGIWIQYMK